MKGVEMFRVKCQYLAITPLGLIELSRLMGLEPARQCRTYACQRSGLCGKGVSVHGAKRDSCWFARALSFRRAAEGHDFNIKNLNEEYYIKRLVKITTDVG
jgi:hypothetical protein